MSGEQIPFEIVEQILVRCPVKSLLRFMCVSKLWYETIRSNRFNHAMLMIKKINAGSSNNYMQLIQQYNKDYPTLEDIYKKTMTPISRDTLLTDDDEKLRFQRSTTYEILGIGHGFTYRNAFDMIDHRWLRNFYAYACLPNNSPNFAKWVLGRSNGMVCLCYDKYIYDCTIKYTIWNPALRKYIKLPYPSLTDARYSFNIGHGYARYSFNIGHGFWYDDNTNDFKLIRVFGAEDVVAAEIYELKKNAWRVIDKSPKLCPKGVATVWFKGGLHWLHRIRHGETGGFVVVIFDVKDESFKVVEVPRDLKSYNSCLGVLGGHLCIVTSKFGEIWVMKEYGVDASWSKQYVLNRSMSVIGLSRDEKRVLVISGPESDVKYMEYDPETHLSTVIPHHLLVLYLDSDHCADNLTLLNTDSEL